MLERLVEAVTRYTKRQGGPGPFATAIDGVMILRSDHERPPNHMIFKPALCIVVQGAKWSIFGDQRFDYRAGQALLVSVEMPAIGRIAQASPTEPFLGLVIELDPAVLQDVVDGLEAVPPPTGDVRAGVFVSDFDGPLADCALRAVRLLETPKAIALLYPAIMREICYWLVAGPHGGDVVRMMLGTGHEARLVRAIHALRARFAESVRIDELAAIAQLSPSAFHRQFKAMTSLTPLQYQKQLRLIEARRLMASGAANVETAAFQVGYESPSQFSREYSRMFGKPPRRDVALLRRAA
jgi:AraC-like DNA-binding protein